MGTNGRGREESCGLQHKRHRQVLTRTVMSCSPHIGHHIRKLRVTIRSLFQLPPQELHWMKSFLSTPCRSTLSCTRSISNIPCVPFIAQWALLINYCSGVRGLLCFSQVELDAAQTTRRSYYSDLIIFFFMLQSHNWPVSGAEVSNRIIYCCLAFSMIFVN